MFTGKVIVPLSISIDNNIHSSFDSTLLATIGPKSKPLNLFASVLNSLIILNLLVLSVAVPYCLR